MVRGTMNWKGLGRNRQWPNRDIARHYPRGTEENQEKRMPASQCPGKDSNRAPLEHTPTALPLHQPIC
jgi:hypothetical protein